MKVNSLIKNTKAYKIFSGDKKNNTLSHATLIVCDDSELLETYLKVFCKTLMCESIDFCDNCRVCRLIDSKQFEDVKFYPEDGKIKTKDVDDLVEKSYLKPLESDKKLFVLVNAQEMNAQSQNKLLKTLEEPPKNTYIILGATSTYTLLPTLLSRVKRLDILPFTDEEILSCLESDYTDYEKLKTAVSVCNGVVSEAIKKYQDDEIKVIENLVYDIFTKMKSSKDVAFYSSKINKNNIKDVIAVSSRLISDLLRYKSVDNTLNKITSNKIEVIKDLYTVGALLQFSEKLREIEKSLYFNGNIQAVSDLLLFGLLEGKYKWSK